MEAPRLGHAPYRQVVSWGQTAYFALDVESLKRMAGSRKLELDVRAPGASSARFAATSDSGAILTQYLQSRGLTGD
jgi:hypothetical protein